MKSGFARRGGLLYDTDMESNNRFPLALRHPDPAVLIRPVQRRDIPDLHRCCFPENSPEWVERLVSRALRISSQGRGGGVVVCGDDLWPLWAYCQVTQWTNTAELSDLMVTETKRSQGIGTAVIQHMCRRAREMAVEYAELGVALSNPRALALYRRLGFQDHRTINVRLESESEPVLYLRLKLP
jgi:ribosomal protein S18 acetylase RimI-like enzyme